MMSALRRLRRSCSFELPPPSFEFAAVSDEFRDSVSVLFAVALAETGAEPEAELLLGETSPPPLLLLEFPCPESDESWLGLISRSVELRFNWIQPKNTSVGQNKMGNPQNNQTKQ